MDTPPAPESLSAVQVQRDAVLNRLDIRRSLAQYAAAEAAVHSEIAKQYPNFNIGPGYTYEERNSFFTVGFSTSLPVFNRNQGPIAEAESRRSTFRAYWPLREHVRHPPVNPKTEEVRSEIRLAPQGRTRTDDPSVSSVCPITPRVSMAAGTLVQCSSCYLHGCPFIWQMSTGKKIERRVRCSLTELLIILA